jgi:predicted ATPase/DNA-binding SARP family transcriptional activator
MKRLASSLLGPMRVTIGGNPARFEADTARALLAYLVVHRGTPLRRETLAGLLWPDQPERAALGNLRQALTRVRRAIGDRDADPPFLLVTRKTVQLNPRSDHWLDVTAFTEAMDASQKHRHRRLEVCRRCMGGLGEALELYRGEFLAGFSLPSAAFEEWLVVQRERLHRQALEGLGNLRVYHERRGEWAQVEGYARRELELEPWREGAQRGLMRALAMRGQRAAALAQYQTCCEVMAEELGVEPEEETTALYEQIREGAELDALSPPPPHNLPVQPTPFVGREALLAEIEERLLDPDCRLLTLVGPGGSGKTRLAVEAAAAQRYAFDHGVFFVNLAPLQSAVAIVPTIAQALGFSFYAGEEHGQQLLDYVRNRSMLLILDNFEHLLVPAAPSEGRGREELVADLLKRAPDVTILATSRARLNLQGEGLFHVAGMDVPDEEILEEATQSTRFARDATQYGAVELFFTSARQVQPSFEFTARNAAEIVRICRLVDGMPLAILLAAGWVQVLTPEQIVSEIQHSLDFLRTDLSDVPERHRSMRAVFDHSWRLLTQEEQKIFQGLSVFRGVFTREAAQAVTGATLRELMALVNKSLLQRAGSERYDMHSLLRDYASEKLDSSGEADAARDAHCAFYAAFMDERSADLRGRRQLGALDEIKADYENVRAAWHRGIERRDYTAVGQMLGSLGWFCEYRSRADEHRELYQQAREGLAPGPDEEPHALWEWLPVPAYYANTQDADRAQIQRCLAIAEKQDDRWRVAACLRVLGDMALRTDDYVGALTFFQKSLAIYRDLDDGFLIAVTLYDLAQTYRLLVQPKDAIKCARQSLELSREIGDKYVAAWSLVSTGIIAFYTGNFAEAGGYLREANAIYCEMGNKVGIATSNVILSKLAFLERELDEQDALTEEALELATDIGNKRIAEAVRNLPAFVALTLGEKVDAYEEESVPVTVTETPFTIDRFQVKELCAVGGQWAVYLAYDPVTGRDVALKLAYRATHRQFGRVRESFRREAEIMTRLAHPALPDFIDYIETADHASLALEFIAGKTLEVMIGDEGFLPVEDVIHWLVQIGDVLICLHNTEPEPIIYRDMKPQNVIVQSDGRAVLVDLGITEAYEPGREMEMIGTEGYAPPEQYVGYTDARSDVYALGATLHHLLTRRDPRQETPFSFHDAPPRSLNPAISEELEAVVLKAVEYKAEDRYQSVEEMQAALQACLG